MAWFYLFLAGLVEIAWALGLKASEGLTRPWLSCFTILGMILSFFLLSLAMKSLPVGTAYAIWTGIGALGTTVFGMIFFGESHDAVRLFCLGLIILGVVGLKFFSSES